MRRQRDDVLLAIRREAASAIIEQQVKSGRYDCGRFAAYRLDLKTRCLKSRPQASLSVLQQRAADITDDDAGERQQQMAVLFGDLIEAAYENASRTIDQLRLRTGCHHTDDAFRQFLAVKRGILDQDHQINRQAMAAPPRMRAQHFADKVEPIAIADPQQTDGQVARDTVAPQSRTRPPIAHDGGRSGTTMGTGENQASGDARESLNLDLADAELGQDDLAMSDRQGPRTVSKMRIAIALGHGRRPLMAFSYGVDDVEHHPLTWCHGHCAPQRQHRIQDGTERARERARGADQRLRIRDRATATNKSHAFGLAALWRPGGRVLSSERQQVDQPPPRLAV